MFALPSKVAFSSLQIQPQEYIDSTGGTGDILDKPVGTGPYMLDTWARGQPDVQAQRQLLGREGQGRHAGLSLEYRGRPALGRATVRHSRRDRQRRRGRLRDCQERHELAAARAPGAECLLPGHNNTYKPFDNEKVRQAIGMAIDKERLVKNFYPPGSTSSEYFTPCALSNGCVGEAWNKFDPAAAKQLLTEAGFPDGFETTLEYRDVVRGYLPQPAQVAQDIQAQLKENLNITIQINVMESGAFIDAANGGQLQGLHMLGWGADYPDITNFLDFHFGEGASPQFGTGFTICTAAERGRSLADEAARNRPYAQANERSSSTSR